jgi:hypothetical protein
MAVGIFNNRTTLIAFIAAAIAGGLINYLIFTWIVNTWSPKDEQVEGYQRRQMR